MISQSIPKSVVWHGVSLSLVAYSAIVVAIGLLHYFAVAEIIAFWKITLVYGHGALLSLYVIFVAGSEAAKRPLLAQEIGFVRGSLVLLLGIALVLATILTVMLAEMVLLPALLFVCIAIAFGNPAARKLLLPFATLVAALPIWDFLIGPLQAVTIEVTNFLLLLFQRTAYVSGDMVFLRSGSFVVERGCSGLNYFMTGMMLGPIYAYWFLERTWARAVAIVLALGIAILANWVRVFGIVMAGDLTAMQHSLVKDHIAYGWVVLALLFVPLFLFGHRLERDSRPAANTPREQEGSPVRAVDNSTLHRRMLVLFALLVLPSIAYYFAALVEGNAGRVAIQAPDNGQWAENFDGVQSRDLGTVFDDAPSILDLVRADETGTTGLAVFAYDQRDRDTEMVGYPNRWYDPETWSLIDSRTLSINGDRARRGLRQMVLARGDEQVVVLVGYVSALGATSSGVEAKLQGLLSRLGGQPAVAAVLITARCESSCEPALAETRELAAYLVENRHRLIQADAQVTSEGSR